MRPRVTTSLDIGAAELSRAFPTVVCHDTETPAREAIGGELIEIEMFGASIFPMSCRPPRL